MSVHLTTLPPMPLFPKSRVKADLALPRRPWYDWGNVFCKLHTLGNCCWWDCHWGNWHCNECIALLMRRQHSAARYLVAICFISLWLFASTFYFQILLKFTLPLYFNFLSEKCISSTASTLLLHLSSPSLTLFNSLPTLSLQGDQMVWVIVAQCL